MIRSSWRRSYSWALLILMILGLSACTTLKPKVEPLSASSKPPARNVELPGTTYQGIPCYLHKVRWPEESLPAIARWYTGNSDNARILARITPNLRPNDLRKGDVVFIPKELSRRSEPMTRRHARRYGKSPVPVDNKRPKTSVPKDDKVPQDEPRPVPYGPRTFPN